MPLDDARLVCRIEHRRLSIRAADAEVRGRRAVVALDAGAGDRSRRALLRAELHADREFAASAEDGGERRISESMRLRTKTLAARRNRLLALRDEGVIGDEAFQQLEKELDFVDLALGGPKMLLRQRSPDGPHRHADDARRLAGKYILPIRT